MEGSHSTTSARDGQHISRPARGLCPITGEMFSNGAVNRVNESWALMRRGRVDGCRPDFVLSVAPGRPFEGEQAPQPPHAARCIVGQRAFPHAEDTPASPLERPRDYPVTGTIAKHFA